MNNDELQKAIDDITNNNAAAEAAPAVDATAENEQLANELAAAAPAPEAVAPEAPAADAGGFAPAPAPAPEVPAEPGMPPVAGEAVASAPEAVPEVPAAEVAPVEAPAEEAVAMPEIKLNDSLATEAVPAASDDETLNEAYKALYPLLDKVEMPVEEKFDITMKFGEPAKALELAKQIADDTSKANALMKIIEKLK